MITIAIWLLRHKTFGLIFRLYLYYATIAISCLFLLFLYYCIRYFSGVQHSEVPTIQWNDIYEFTEDEEELFFNPVDSEDEDGDSMDGNHTNATTEEDGGDRPPNPSRGDIPPNPSRGDIPSNPSRGDIPPNPSRGDIPSNTSRGDIPPNPSRGNCGCICHTFCNTHTPVPYNADHDDDCDCRLCITDDEISDYSEEDDRHY